MSRLARRLGLGCAFMVLVSVGSCVISFKRYMRPRSIGVIPAASALVVTNNLVGPQARTAIREPRAVQHIIEKMNTHVAARWHPAIWERPLAQLSVSIETLNGDVAYWNIGEGWFGAGGLYKEVPVQERDELEAMLKNAPHVDVQERPK